MSFFYKEQERVRKEIKAWRPYNTLAVNYMLTDTRTPICPWPYRQRLTVSAGADVEKPGLSTWTEALIGRIICTAGKKSLRSHEAVHGNPARYTWPLVHQLHGPEFGQLPVNVPLETVQSFKSYYVMVCLNTLFWLAGRCWLNSFNCTGSSRSV